MIIDQVQDIIAKEFGAATTSLRPETRLVEDLGLDSLDAVELMLSLEDAFGFKISDEEAIGLKSIRDIVDLVTVRKAGGSTDRR